jgi:hypothetical protein
MTINEIASNIDEAVYGRGFHRVNRQADFPDAMANAGMAWLSPVSDLERRQLFNDCRFKKPERAVWSAVKDSSYPV